MAVPTAASIAALFRAALLSYPASGALDNAGLTAFCTALAEVLFDNAPGTTPEGGTTIVLTNRTGAASVKGTVVKASTSFDSAFDVAEAGSYSAIGVVYDDGIANGSPCRVVTGGIAEVLLEDTTAATRGYWVRVSDSQAGRARVLVSPSGGFPAATDEHFREIGHCYQSVTAGTDKTALCEIHPN